MDFSKLLDLLTKPAKFMVSLLEKYDMEANKIAASIFLAGVIAMFAGLITGFIYPSHDSHADAKRGYTIAGAEAFEAGAANGGGEKKEEGPVDIAVFLASADIAAGEKLLKRCTACHTFDQGGKNGVGPNNYGIVGKPIATVAGFTYSDALNAKKGEDWTFQALSEFLESPKKYAPGNKMAFAGLRKPADRANLLAYLNTLGSNKPYPEPKPVEAEPAEEAEAAEEAAAE